eukprot:CAMPEP_0114584818 /NCGR_PEP_ID=MMETSP0125-20121206/8451_1 /TAXON_ID=485358 ORGANISM="Aristerostoma sp., Strain ATCC 50986" /NCGR_SAMPLE_ID=MMETSP0125 /ASSEMBLY_ACC=CAM_ASM_000245 /LENGTH=62 /DNA_ID=CAMNT_0001779455 /DNA_START=692 /DNA_END=880 /DNA_ORIENTATION=+
MNSPSLALERFSEALNIEVNNNGENHEDNAPILMNIGISYEQYGDYKEAAAYFKKALKLDKK